jgi:peroxiredoxin
MFGKKVGAGQPATEFTLQSAEKESVSLRDLRGKTVLLSFLQSSG